MESLVMRTGVKNTLYSEALISILELLSQEKSAIPLGDLDGTYEHEITGNALGLQYRIDQNPSWILCIFLGLQHYLTMFGSTVAVPFILAPHLCIDKNPLALSEVISTIFFVSGLATLLQTFLGNRLPIIQGATFAFLGPTIAILQLQQCQSGNAPKLSSNSTDATTRPVTQDDWRPRMLEVQGAIMVASLFQIFVGFSGLMGLMMRFVGPLTVAPTIALIGLALFGAAGDFSGKQWGIAAMTVFFIILFSQLIKEVKVPFPWYKRGTGMVAVWSPIFKLFPIILAIIISWVVSAIITAAGGFPSDPKKSAYSARTDARSQVLKNADWIRVPYPGQWGTPTVSLAGVFGMLAGVLASMIESIGDYYACARLSGAPAPPKHAVNRGIGIEGIGCLLAGAWGSGNGTTSYSENVGALGVTKVGSRRVVQVGAVIMLILAVFGKFGALFTTIPDPIVGGMFWALFGMILAVGISNLQFVDLNSSRNLFVLGFSFFTGMVVPAWLGKPENANAIQTGVKEIDQIIVVLLKTNMAIGGITALILDNLLPGTKEERGITKWRPKGDRADNASDGRADIHVYDIPFITPFIAGKRWVKYIPFLPFYPESTVTINKEKSNSNDTKLNDI